MNICVFGSSSEQIDKIYLESAEHLGKKIAEKGYNLVFGAGYKFNSSEVTRLKGDVDNNGIINVVDATDIQKYVVNLTDENGNKFIDVNNAEDMYAADVNGDGIINVVDATLIQKYLVRLVESL